MKFVPNMGKMGEIFDKSKREKFIKVVLKENNEVIFCKADNFIYLPLDEDSDDDCPEDITYIHVILKDGTNRLLTNEDIKKVFDYEEPTNEFDEY